MSRPQNLKKPSTCFDRTTVFTQYRQKQWEIFFKFLLPFQKSWTLPRSKTFLNPSHLFSVTCTRLSIRLSISSLSFLYLAEFSLSLLYKELCLLKISCNSFWRLGILSWSGNWAISWILISNFSPHWIATNFNDKFLSTAWSAGVFLNLWKKYFRNLSLFRHKKKGNEKESIDLNSHIFVSNYNFQVETSNM